MVFPFGFWSYAIAPSDLQLPLPANLVKFLKGNLHVIVLYLFPAEHLLEYAQLYNYDRWWELIWIMNLFAVEEGDDMDEECPEERKQWIVQGIDPVDKGDEPNPIIVQATPWMLNLCIHCHQFLGTHISRLYHLLSLWYNAWICQKKFWDIEIIPAFELSDGCQIASCINLLSA